MKKIKLLMPILGISAIASTAIPLASCSCKSKGVQYVTDITQEEWTAAWDFFDPSKQDATRNYTYEGTFNDGNWCKISIDGSKEQIQDLDPETGEVTGNDYSYINFASKKKWNWDTENQKWDEATGETLTWSGILWSMLATMKAIRIDDEKLTKIDDHYHYEYSKEGVNAKVDFYFIRTSTGVKIAKDPITVSDGEGEYFSGENVFSYGNAKVENIPTPLPTNK